jgi:hypothetical protein
MTKKYEYMLNDSFEVSGEWWLPDNPGEKLYGTLRYSPTNIELELSGTLAEITDAHLTLGASTFKDHPCVHGLTHERQKFTLLRVGAFSLSATTKYNASHIITDKHVPALVELKVRRISFYCDHLDKFICRDLFSQEKDGHGRDFKSYTIKYTQPDKIAWRIDGIGATLDLQTSMRASSNRDEQWHKLHAQSHVTITPDTHHDLEWYVDQIWRFCYLLTLITDEVTSPTGIEIYLEDDKYSGWHLYNSAKSRPINEMSAPSFLFHLAHLIDIFESILNKWFSVSDTLLDSIHLLMDAQRSQGHNVEGRFLLLAHAVEVISRATTSSEYMPKADYDIVIKAMNESIPTNVDSDHRMSLKSKIKFGNEFAFHKRIKVLLESLSEECQRIVCSDIGKFSRGIADTRNYYTHFTDELRLKALPVIPMYWATEKLSFLMRIVLLRYLGISEEKIAKQMNRHHRLLQKIFNSKKHPEMMIDNK